MSWRRRIGIGLAVVGGLLAAGGAALWIWAPWVPPVEVADPGPEGRRIVEPGLLANYFPGKGAGPRPGILLLGGSEGGLGLGSAGLARMLAAEGFSVLQPSYFRAPGQPIVLERVPLEGFDRALDWLRAQRDVAGDRIAVVGGSKGAEAALLIAVRHPELKAVVAAMPTSAVWSGVDWKTFSSKDSSWSERGKPVPFLQYGRFDYEQGVISGYREGLATLAQNPGAEIPVERSLAPILLICGEQDTMWPACAMARQVEARALSSGRPQVTVLAYPDAGHAVFGRPRPAGDPDFEKLGSLGGSAQGNNAARIDNWPKTLAFLKTALMP